MNPPIQLIIDHFQLKKHPEGGLSNRTYKSNEIINHHTLPDRFQGDRSFSSAIYYLVPCHVVSKLHRLKADEIWHFYLGSPFTLIEIDEKGESLTTILGKDVLHGEEVQHVVKQGTWVGGFVGLGGDYSLLGCTIAPAFDEHDFELANVHHLLKEFPHLSHILSKFL